MYLTVCTDFQNSQHAILWAQEMSRNAWTIPPTAPWPTSLTWHPLCVSTGWLMAGTSCLCFRVKCNAQHTSSCSTTVEHSSTLYAGTPRIVSTPAPISCRYQGHGHSWPLKIPSWKTFQESSSLERWGRSWRNRHFWEAERMGSSKST